ncbi:MAG TPA: pyruvate:ferredoxin (flavodoxin) oxidoreductase [Vicinamibacterales bacterium]|nr:pyruvate:ferredoxin (flavodoxin) oxidoreductase [Vicinamibacterales bacterium]
MRHRNWIAVDGNEAVAAVAYRASEVIAIYPITPSSPMGELADEWSVQGRRNIWGTVPQVTELQSEAGAIGAVHGALQAGAVATTFTSSQGLLLMIPTLYKIAGELTAFCMHVAARAVATHALSIFGDHSDVMACRQTGMALLASGSVQEAQDLAVIGQAATFRSRVPVLHFFDGFRTSHEVARIRPVSDDDLRAMLPADLVAAHRARALTPDRPVLRGSAQNPDVFFQAREACNPFHLACPTLVQQAMDQFAALTGRQYRLFEYVGHPEAERVLVMMGSGAETAHETVEYLVARGEKVGLVKVRLYRPFSVSDFVRALPPTVRAVAALDRTKEPGAVGEPLYLDVVAALAEGRAAGVVGQDFAPRVVGGRYGLASKEFTPAMVKAVFDELGRPNPKPHFTVGINDDVTRLSLPCDPDFDIESPAVSRAVFFGLGSDGTVGANKNSIKIIAEESDRFAQGYFVYDSKKAGAVTVSHLRFGPQPIRSAYLIRQAEFVACHQWSLLERHDVVAYAAPGGTLLVNAPYPPEAVWDELPYEVQERILEKRLRVFTIDAHRVAREAGLGSRINTIMQTCFFAIANLLPREQAIQHIKGAIRKSYRRRGEEVVRKNHAAVDAALEHLHALRVPEQPTSPRHLPPPVPDEAPDFVKRVTALMLAGHGDLLPVSALPVDGTWPLGTARWEKRNLALEIPVWEPALCIQCNKCALICPHAAIRTLVYPASALAGAPASFKADDYRGLEFKGFKYTVQVAPEDCTGCTLCVAICPAKDKRDPSRKALAMHPQAPLRERERENFAFFLTLPPREPAEVKLDVKGSQLLEPLFEFSGACAGCGETPYIKLLTQLFGDRVFIANATGCSSIYGGNLPTTPYTTNRDGRGPAWSNSLFENNAEFGFGFRLALDQHVATAAELLRQLAGEVGERIVDELLAADQRTAEGVAAQRERVARLKQELARLERPEARRLAEVADYLVRKTVWIVGGDGWAYDIGFGGLDHVLATGADVNLLVLDTEVYSNTGGQQSKATPLGAAARFAAAGKAAPKKDLALMAMTYGRVYVAQVACGVKDAHTVKVFQEADSFPGPSLILAYSHCIAHGYDMALALEQQHRAIESAYWPLFRFDPRRAADGMAPLVLDSPPPRVPLERYVANEARFRTVADHDPERFQRLLAAAERHVRHRYAVYQHLAALHATSADKAGTVPADRRNRA